MSRTFQPLAHRVVVKMHSPEVQTEGGVVIPDQYAKKSSFAEVIEVGSGKWLDSGEHAPMSVKPGDQVIVLRGHSRTFEGQDFVFVNEEDIMAIVDGENIIPLNDWVFMKRRPSDNKTAGGIFIPEKNIAKHQESDVIGVGPGKILSSGLRSQMSAQPGDRVIVPKSVEVMRGDQELIFSIEDGILCVVTP